MRSWWTRRSEPFAVTGLTRTIIAQRAAMTSTVFSACAFGKLVCMHVNRTLCQLSSAFRIKMLRNCIYQTDPTNQAYHLLWDI